MVEVDHEDETKDVDALDIALPRLSRRYSREFKELADFKIDYVRQDGDLSNFVPDFIAKTKDGTVWIIETKGRHELDLPQKMNRLSQWCVDATHALDNGARFDFVFVDEQSFEKHSLTTFEPLASSFREYKDAVSE